jgi:hypothetical protein
MRYIKTHIIYLLALLASFSACSKSEKVIYEPDTGTKVRFELFTRAGSYGLPISRAVADESSIDKQPWVLVFSGTGGTASFVEAVQAEILNNKTYIYLNEQTSACQLLILANPPSQFYVEGSGYAYTSDNFANTLGSHDLDYACRNLLTEPLTNPQYSVPYVGQKLPMSDLISVSKIDVSVTIPQINLKRIVGKVIVKNIAPDFVLEGITTVTNIPGQGQFYNLDGTLLINNLVEYRGNASYSTDIVNAETISASEQSTESSPLYLYESNTQTNASYLIIRGTYKGESYFYKMAFVNNNQNVLNILRNTEYEFTITSVKGQGFKSVEDAKISLASNSNLKFTTLVQDDSGYEIMTNNDYYLAVTNSHLELYTIGGTGDTYTAFTLITDCGHTFPNKRTITSLTSGLEIVSPADGKIPVGTTTPYDVKIKVAAGFTTGQIEIYLGNLRKIVTVTRKDRVVAGGTTITAFMENGYYISASVEDYNNHSWLQLAPGDGIVRNDPDYIYVDDGLITLKVGTGSGSIRNGTVYVSAKEGTETKRIKVYITQAAMRQV